MTRQQIIHGLAQAPGWPLHRHAMEFVWSINDDTRATMFVPQYKKNFAVAGRVVRDAEGHDAQDANRDRAQYIIRNLATLRLVKQAEFFRTHPCPALPANFQPGGGH